MKPESTEAIQSQRLIACIRQHYSISALQFLSELPSILQTDPQTNKSIDQLRENEQKQANPKAKNMCVWRAPARCVDDDDRDVIRIVVRRETRRREHRRNLGAERLRRGGGDETGFAGAAVADDDDSDGRACAGSCTATCHRFRRLLTVEIR